jgi:uncharacterized membrane-anchored protein YitT (DUF2179 family)
VGLKPKDKGRPRKMKEKQTEQKEIARIKLSDNQDLVASLIDNEKLDLRIFVKTDSYTGATKRGVRFYLFDDNWPEFKKLVQKIDKVFEEL